MLLKKWHKVKKPKKDESDVSKMAIGVEGGFDPESTFDVIKEHSVFIMPERISVWTRDGDKHNGSIRLSEEGSG